MVMGLPTMQPERMPRPEIIATVATLRAAFGSGTFTSRDAVEHGVPHHRLAAAARSGLLHRLRRGHYRLAGPNLAESRLADGIDRLRALGIPACAGMLSSVSEWTLPIWLPVRRSHPAPMPAAAPVGLESVSAAASSGLAAPPTVLVPRSARVGRGLRGGIFVRACDVDPRRIVLGPSSMPTTDPMLTAVHVCSTPGTSFAQCLVLLCGAMRRQIELTSAGASSIERLANSADVRRSAAQNLLDALEFADIPSRRRVLAAAAHADPRMETALESVSWARFIESGIDLPVPQVWVKGASGRSWRVDFLFGDRVIGECDGAVKYAGVDSLWKEKKRQSDLEAAGFIVVRWTWEEIVFRPHVVLARIALALSRAA